MASKTTNYNLHKIDLADSPPDITVLNQNFDVIDTELKEQDTILTQHLDDYATTQSLTYYVNASTGNDANDGLSVTTALKTVQAAINKLPRVINHYCLVNIAAGTYNEDVQIVGRIGESYFDIDGIGKSAILKSISVTQNSCYVGLVGLKINEGITSSRNMQVKWSESESTGSSVHGVSSYADNIFVVENVVISNKSDVPNAAAAIRAFQGSKMTIKNVSGANNHYGLRAFEGSEIVKNNVTLTAAIPENIVDGGLIR